MVPAATRARPAERATASRDDRRPGVVRLHVHVKPSASHAAVGGTLGGALVVRVAAPATRGRATAAALAALAAALGIRVADVHLVTTGAARRKLVDVHAGAHAREVRRRADALRARDRGHGTLP